MLSELKEALKELPELLKDDEGWSSLDITYHAPRVKRLYRQWGDYRINLHEISPCGPGEALFHRHPWSSAMIVLVGVYEMGVGYGPGLEKPPIAAKIIMKENSCYEQTEFDSWHYVRPLTTVYTVMLTGKPWETIGGPKYNLEPLTSEEKEDMLTMFSNILTAFPARVPRGV